ncbi:MAG: glycoside hydrolase family 3 protein [Candidatus Wildermuthbacteria bacterium]|nr:glycoside hydrolase family 3 protein [Candidatus Wildermuthbacteria bacterium]
MPEMYNKQMGGKRVHILWFIFLLLVTFFGRTVFTTMENQKLRAMIGQMLIVGFRGTVAANDSYEAQMIQDIHPGGVILFDYDVPSKSRPRNIVNPQQTQKLISNVKQYSEIPLFIAVDLEGGMVNRLKPRYGFTDFPSHEELGEKDNLAETEKVSGAIAEELAGLGFNLNFAPVVDVNINSRNPIIGSLGRSFSADPVKVVAHALAFIKGHRAHTVVTALKHFPGHGSSQEDSHLGLVDVTQTYQSNEIIPYEEIIAQGMADMVMTAHIVNRAVDLDFPVTLSTQYIEPILRRQFGFQGVVVADDMHMGAIAKNYGFTEAIVKAIQAGSDMLIISNNVDVYDEQAPYEAREAIFLAVKNGQISKTRIRESYERIMNLKERFRIL